MTAVVLTATLAGVVLGRFSRLGALDASLREQMTTVALCVLLLCVGLELGRPGDHWHQLRRLGRRCLWLPAGIAVGSLLGPLIVSHWVGVPATHAIAIGGGFGWYSLAGVLLTELHSPALGALGFLTNLLRELLAFALIPLLAARLGPLTALGPAGATAMDTTLPMIQRTAGPTAAVLAFLSGALLSGLVPILVPLLARLCP